jgi:hypothetical protein
MTEFEQTKQLAEQGDADAQYMLGEMYYYGEGVGEDDAKKALFDAIMTAGFLIDDSLIYQYKNVDKSKDGKVMHDLDKKGFCLVEFEKIEGATGGFVGVRASDFEIDNKLI